MPLSKSRGSFMISIAWTTPPYSDLVNSSVKLRRTPSERSRLVPLVAKRGVPTRPEWSSPFWLPGSLRGDRARFSRVAARWEYAKLHAPVQVDHHPKAYLSCPNDRPDQVDVLTSYPRLAVQGINRPVADRDSDVR